MMEEPQNKPQPDRLTQRFVDTVKVVKARRYADHDVRGLYLQVRPSGAKTWLFRFWKGTQHGRDMGLGSARTFNLTEARARAIDCRKKLADGIDPLADKRARRVEASRGMTVRQAVKEYFANKSAEWGKKHGKNYMSAMERFVFLKLGDRDVNDVVLDDVVRAVREPWMTVNPTMVRTCHLLKNVFASCIARGVRTNSKNPLDGLKTVLPKPSKVHKTRSHARLEAENMPAFIARIRKSEGTSPRGLEFTILTGARTTEVRLARWSEIDLESRTWTLPPERMKMDRQHRVALSEAACALLRALPREEGCDFVFPGAKPDAGLSENAMLKFLRTIDPNRTMTVHGMRSTIRDWGREAAGFPRDVCEAMLAHKDKNGTEAAYARGDLLEARRPLMEAWARFCNGEETPSNVIALRK
jgi:integrase